MRPPIITDEQLKFLSENDFERDEIANLLFFVHKQYTHKVIKCYDNSIELLVFRKNTNKYISILTIHGIKEMPIEHFKKILDTNGFIIKTQSESEADEKFEMDHGTNLRNHLS